MATTTSSPDGRLMVAVAVLLASVAVLTAASPSTSSFGILDWFSWDDVLDYDASPASNSPQQRNEEGLVSERNCVCEGPSCNCCLDFNFTYVDLGGPGCVRMKYLSPSEGIAVNVSYGPKLLHSEVVKGANPDPTCIDLLSDLAQLCARFSDLAPTSDGLRWCLQLEPTLLNEVQTQYQLGCFRMGPEGMSVDPPVSNATETSTEAAEVTNEETTEINEEALIAAVNESAEEGIAFFTNLLGLSFGNEEQASNSTETDATATNATSADSTTAASAAVAQPVEANA